MKNVNLIGINWDIGAQAFSTSLSQSFIRTVAYHTAAFIRKAIEENVLELNNLEIVGHSLGSHIAGLGAYTFYLIVLFDFHPQILDSWDFQLESF